MKAESFGWVHDQYPVDKIFGVEGDLDIGGKDVPIVLYILVGLLDSVVLEGRFAEQQGIHDDSNRPDINLIAMTLFFQNLRGDVIGCPTYGLLAITLALNFSR